MTTRIRHTWLSSLQDESGQMVVELAVLMPVLLVVALLVINIASYIELSARFNRIARHAVTTFAVSSGRSDRAVCSALEDEISRSLNSSQCSVEVTASPCSGDTPLGLALGGKSRLTKYICTMKMIPWPSHLVIAHSSYQLPITLDYSCSLIIDAFRLGVLL